MANQVYDPEADEQNAPEFDTGANPYDNQTAPGRINYTRDDLRDDEESTDNLYNPEGDSTTNNKTSTANPSALRQSEASAGAADDQVGSGYNPADQPSRRKQLKGFATRNRKKLIGGGAIGGGLTGILISLLFTLAPLKIEHMIQNLQDRFSHPLTSAVEGANSRLLKRYIVKYVIPNYKDCGVIIDRKCKVRIVGGESNPATNMYRAWAKTSLEKKLFAKGIELKYDTGSKTWRMDGVDIGDNGQNIDDAFDGDQRRAFRNRAAIALGGETKWKEVMYRYKVGRLMSRTDGIKRHIFFNGTRNSIDQKIENKTKAAKLILAERVLKPRSEMTFIAVTCILDDSCRPGETSTDGDEPPLSDTEREQREKLVALAATYGVTDIAKLNSIHASMSERGFQRYMVDQVLEKIFRTASQQTVRRATDFIPIIGWIDLGASVIETANDSGPKLRKLAYLTNSIAAAQLFWTYRTYADEIHTGEVDGAVVGSMVSSLGSGEDNKNGPPIGGKASAEEAPLYDELVNGGAEATPRTASLISPFLPASASAAAENQADNSSKYRCNNNKAPPKDSLCDEEKLGQGNVVADAVNDLFSLPGFSQIVSVAKLWNKTFGAVFDFVGDTAGNVISGAAKAALEVVDDTCVRVDIGPIDLRFPGPIQGYCEARDLAREYAPKIVEVATNALIPNPFGDNMGGGRTFTMVAAGANVTGNDACAQAGCQAVDPVTAGAIIKEQQAKAYEEFAAQSFMSRMFNRDSSHSLISKMAMATPFDMRGAAQTNFAKVLLNPLSSASSGLSGLGAMFSQGRASAGQDVNCDPFNVGCSAFPSSLIPDDPEKYWDDNNCGDESENGPIAKWYKESAKQENINEKTGMPINRKSEPCLLIKYATGTTGGAFDKSLLTEEDLAESNTAAPSAANPAGSADADDSEDPPACTKDHIYKPGRLHFKGCKTVTGKIVAVGKSTDGDYHAYLDPDPQYRSLMNNRQEDIKKNFRRLMVDFRTGKAFPDGQYLIIEDVCLFDVNTKATDSLEDSVEDACRGYKNKNLIPEAGKRYKITGNFIADGPDAKNKHTGWNEIHGLSAIKEIP